MKTPKAPAAPDPQVTAAAQTGTNVSTAIANAHLQNVNQITPDGNLTFSQNGTTQFRDPTSGAIYDLPNYTATTSLSPQQQAIKEQNDASELNLAKTANQQSSFLQGYLGRTADTSGVPGVQYGVQSSPIAQTSRGLQYDLGTGIGIRSTIDPTSGNIQYGFGDAGKITKSYNGDFSADRQRVEDALFARLNPQLDRDREALRTELSNQGIKLGSEAYATGLDEYGRRSNDARLGAILNAGQEQTRLVNMERDRAVFENSAQNQNFGQLATRTQINNSAQQQEFGQNATRAQFANDAQQQWFGQALSRAQHSNATQQQEFGQNAARSQQDFNQGLANAQLNNQGRSQSLSEIYAARNQPINEITALMGGAQVQNPQFQSTNMPQIPTVDYAGLVQQNYQSQLGAYQQQMQNRNQLLGGVLGLGGRLLTAGIGASDRRLKRDIVRVYTAANGLGVYSYRMRGSDRLEVGFMADEVAAYRPDAVLTMANGFKAVDYGKAAA